MGAHGVQCPVRAHKDSDYKISTTYRRSGRLRAPYA
jgi:hypothetical protein